MADAPKKLDRGEMEQLVAGAHDAMVILDLVVDDMDRCKAKPEDWDGPVDIKKLIEAGTVVLFLSQDQYRALDAAKIAAFCATRKAEEDFLASTGAIE